jgi:hypothetical protein
MIKREKIELVKGSDIYAGIDVASDIHRVRFIDNLGQEVIKGISFSNDREGFRELEEHMKKFGIDHNIIFGLTVVKNFVSGSPPFFQILN